MNRKNTGFELLHATTDLTCIKCNSRINNNWLYANYYNGETYRPSCINCFNSFIENIKI